MKIPSNIIQKVEKATLGLQHGIVSLSLHIRDGKPRYKFVHEEWIIEGEDPSAHDDFKPKRKLDSKT